MTVRERLILFLNHVGLSQYAFEKMVGLSTGFVNNIGDSIRTKSMDKISAVFPQLSMPWLLTGVGEMLKDVPADNVANDDGGAGSYNYITRRRQMKTEPNPDNSSLLYVPIAAQAGYHQSIEDPVFLSQLQRVDIPGLPFKGKHYRLFEVNGDSMEPTLKEGYHVVAELIDQEQWMNIANYYIYVIVTSTQILIKRLFRIDAHRFAMISDNEDFYPQQALHAEEIRELWLVKRKLDWNMPPPKRFDITIQ